VSSISAIPRKRTIYKHYIEIRKGWANRGMRKGWANRWMRKGWAIRG
jgi:hypothetical protein